MICPGCIILWLACLYHTLYSRINGRIWSCLWGAWSCLLEFFGKGNFIVGDLTINGSNGFISCIQIHPQGMFLHLQIWTSEAHTLYQIFLVICYKTFPLKQPNERFFYSLFSKTYIRTMAFMCSEILTIFNFCSLYTAPQIQD